MSIQQLTKRKLHDFISKQTHVDKSLGKVLKLRRKNFALQNFCQKGAKTKATDFFRKVQLLHFQL